MCLPSRGNCMNVPFTSTDRSCHGTQAFHREPLPAISSQGGESDDVQPPRTVSHGASGSVRRHHLDLRAPVE